MEDIKELNKTPSVKYVNIDITNPNLDVIYYLIENGKDYSYSDLLDGQNGYIYVSYEIFKVRRYLFYHFTLKTGFFIGFRYVFH